MEKEIKLEENEQEISKIVEAIKYIKDNANIVDLILKAEASERKEDTKLDIFNNKMLLTETCVINDINVPLVDILNTTDFPRPSTTKESENWLLKIEYHKKHKKVTLYELFRDPNFAKVTKYLVLTLATKRLMSNQEISDMVQLNIDYIENKAKEEHKHG